MSVPVGGRAQVSPWPYTFKLDGVGVMGGTAERQSTTYASTKPPDQGQVAPTDFGYGGDNPAFGAVTAYAQFPLGMGLRQQRRVNAAEDLQYRDAQAVDASVHPIVKGPAVTRFFGAGARVRFMKVGSTYYAVDRRFVYRRDSDTAWPIVVDFGGLLALDAVSFYSNGAGQAYGFVALGDANNLYYVNEAGVWTQHASLKARAFGLVGREFYRAHTTNTLAKVDTDADPTVAANWGNANAFTIGDKSSAIVRLVTTAGGILLAVKTDGVYTLDEAGDDVKLHGVVPTTDGGKAVGRWGNHVYVGFDAAGFWRYDETGSVRQQVGPELLTDGSDTVNGWVTACAGVEGAASALWGAFYQPDTAMAHLCKFVGLVERDGRPHPVWHGSLTVGDDLFGRIAAMDVQPDGAPTDHVRLYLGYGGEVAWLTLPCTAHPADCTAYRFAAESGSLRLPTWTGGFEANQKALDAVTVMSAALDAGDAVMVEAAADLGAAVALGPFDEAPLEKIPFATASAASRLDLAVELANAATTSSPQVTGVGLHWQLQTPYRQVFEIRVLAADGLRRRDGTPYRLGARGVQSLVEQAADPERSPGSVALVLPEGDAKRVRIKDVGKGVAWDHVQHRWQTAYVLTCVEVGTDVVHGTHARLEALGSHAQMEARTHAQLERI